MKMGFRMNRFSNIFPKNIFLTILLCMLWIRTSNAIAVMSVDLGSEWMKIAIVKPGVPMEIVLNKESRRKTPVTVAFRNGERLFGDEALNIMIRFPEKSYAYLLDLVGKKVDNPLVDLFLARFPYYNIVPHPERGTVLFQDKEGDVQYAPEELLAMILRKAKEYAEDFAEQSIKDAVVTVPPFFNQAERRALQAAVELAGLRCLQLMNTNTAVALHYGVFRRKEFNATATNIMFYDMGATSTTATIASYQVVKHKEHGVVLTDPQVQIKGVGVDRTLGGLEMQLRLRDHLARAFNQQKKTSTDVFTNQRSMAKLMKEAGRVKKVLSANADHFAQVEGLLEDKDFSATKVTRQELEDMCADLFERVPRPVEDALSTSHMTLDEIDQVIIVGGNTRIPKVQELLLRAVGKSDLGKSVNADEAAALGAVYQAAALSTNYRVKKFLVKDANLFPIQVDFRRELAASEDGPEKMKTVKRTLFGLYNVFPQKKLMTFNKHTGDFRFFVNYGDLAHFARSHDLKIFGSGNVTEVSLAGVKDALDKHASEEGTEPKGVKAHFRMDESGILQLDQVEAVFETQPEAEPSTLSKIGNTLSNLFGSNKDGAEEPPQDIKEKEEEKQGEDTDKKTEDDEKSGSEAKNKSEDGEDQKKDEKSEGKKVDSEDKKADTDGEKKGNKTEPAVAPKPKIVKEPVKVKVLVKDLDDFSEETKKSILDRLQEFDKAERKKAENEKAKNGLESFVFELQDAMSRDAFVQAAVDTERDEILQLLAATSLWLEDEGYEDGVEASVYAEKKAALEGVSAGVRGRVREAEERPRALAAIDTMLNYSTTFLASMTNLTEDQQIFTEVEITTLEKLVADTKEWLKKKVEEQEKRDMTEEPAFTLTEVAEKVQALDREVKYLLNKAKTAVPKKVKKEKKKEKQETDDPDAKDVEEITEIDDKAEDSPKEDESNNEDTQENQEQTADEQENSGTKEEDKQEEVLGLPDGEKADSEESNDKTEL